MSMRTKKSANEVALKRIIRAFDRAKLTIARSGALVTTLPQDMFSQRYLLQQAIRDYLERENEAHFVERIVCLCRVTPTFESMTVDVSFEPEYDDQGGAFMDARTQVNLMDKDGNDVYPEDRNLDDAGEFLRTYCDLGFLDNTDVQYNFTRAGVDRLLVDGDYNAFLAEGEQAAQISSASAL